MKVTEKDYKQQMEAEYREVVDGVIYDRMSLNRTTSFSYQLFCAPIDGKKTLVDTNMVRSNSLPESMMMEIKAITVSYPEIHNQCDYCDCTSCRNINNFRKSYILELTIMNKRMFTCPLIPFNEVGNIGFKNLNPEVTRIINGGVFETFEFNNPIYIPQGAFFKVEFLGNPIDIKNSHAPFIYVLLKGRISRGIQ